MQLGSLVRTNNDGWTRVSCQLQLSRADHEAPEVIWFEVPDEWAPAIVDRHDPFATASILVASVLEEPLRIGGAVSTRLVRGLRDYLGVFNSWFPRAFPAVAVSADRLVVPDPVADGFVASAFSGGVDSFFTLRRHLSENEPISRYAISHGLFVHGFDINLSDASTYDTAFDNYANLFAELNLTLVPLRTNVRALSQGVGVDWGYAHGTALLAAAQFLGAGLRCCYVPSSSHHSDAHEWGSGPVIDPLLSTESMEVIHDGCEFFRAEKIVGIADWAVTWPRLRVCWEKPDGLQNCGSCYTCLLTMSVLQAAGHLQDYSTFSGRPTPEALRQLDVPWGWRADGRVMSKIVRDAGDDALADAVEDAILKNYPVKSFEGSAQSRGRDSTGDPHPATARAIIKRLSDLFTK